MMVLGIDPGGKGALALYSPLRGVALSAPGAAPVAPETLTVWDMPTEEVTVGNSKRTRISMGGLGALLDEIAMYGVDRIYVEQVGGMPGQASGFAFGWGVGVLHMGLRDRGMAFETITAGKWKKDAKVPKDKKDAVARAEEVFPTLRDRFHVPHATQKGKTVPRPDRAEASLIAWWGSKQP